MTLTGIHGYVIGVAVVGSWVVIAMWSLVLRVRGAEETPVFWRVVSFAQILLVLQFLLGVMLLVLFGLGRAGLPGRGNLFDVSFHLLYGIGFPLVALFFAHLWARQGRFRPHSVFAVTGLVIFGLTARAWMVGAGIG